MEKEYLSWDDVSRLIDRIVPRVPGHFDALIAITRGGIIPGGLLGERLRVAPVFVASVYFFHEEDQTLDWPIFLQFPDDNLLHGKRVLVVDDIWDTGVTITNVRERVLQAGGEPVTLVLHYRPSSSRVPSDQTPDIYGEKTENYIVYPWEPGRRKLGMEG
ncbi:MAG: phosphoribosyltransferase family protein [Anaerolineae bacterium]